MTAEKPGPPQLIPDLPPDGQFLVQRTSGEIEQGWNVHQIFGAVVEDGSTVPAAEIMKFDEDKGLLVKRIPVDRLLEWQQPAETEEAPQQLLV